MSLIDPSDTDTFFRDVEAAAKASIWAAMATVHEGEPRVRMVHPNWEGQTLWIATGPETPKAKQVKAHGRVDIQFQVAPDDFVHLMVRGQATVLQDAATLTRVWDVMDYDLYQFWPEGPSDPNYCVIRVDPERVELSKMFGTMDKRVWRA
ncbi:hypothetical protein EY643_17220 [Halioglobus maricola]|uniref:Pyridoxamine 5'-phosphate oxidase N-terminal domain-containing protein n=1 Tax=Halioglobus maricola TaxID=2601894 RepID=A0A5P9NNL9_9GAMM|nr:pyridoxamine 5'-phosphate oxidase family protein [Halioglobus maricola]QFU77259.1 hypothetical protein EY643_17220 [Halioglobus maricola]